LDFTISLTPKSESALLAAFKKMANERPSESDYAKIGKIALQHTGLEYQMESLVWFYMGDVDKAHIATSQMSVSQTTNMLKTLVEWTEPDDGIADAITYAIDGFHSLRLTRNYIVHGFNFKADNATEKLFIERRTKSFVFDEFERFELNARAFEQVITDQSNLSTYMWKLEKLLSQRGHAALGPNQPGSNANVSLPSKPAPPQVLKALPYEPAKSTRRQRQASLDKENRAAKGKRKDGQREAQKKKS
jgi:hypothetical protein